MEPRRPQMCRKAPAGLVIAGCPIRPAKGELGHWLWLDPFGWHDCSRSEDLAIEQATVREQSPDLN